MRTRTAATGRGTGSDGAARRVEGANLVAFFEQSWAELKKVTWPTRQETINLTVAVIVMTVAIALFLGAWDFILAKLVAWLITSH